MAKITVQNTQITVIKQNEDDYISLTDMLKAKDGEFFFSNWLRNRNTIEFLSSRRLDVMVALTPTRTLLTMGLSPCADIHLE